MPAIVLDEVEPFIEDADGVRYRSCDFCFETACEDIWAGKIDQGQWRRFYLLPDGCSVCEHCVGKVE